MQEDVALCDTKVIFYLKKRREWFGLWLAGLRNVIIIIGYKLHGFCEKKFCPKRINREGVAM